METMTWKEWLEYLKGIATTKTELDNIKKLENKE